MLHSVHLKMNLGLATHGTLFRIKETELQFEHIKHINSICIGLLSQLTFNKQIITNVPFLSNLPL